MLKNEVSGVFGNQQFFDFAFTLCCLKITTKIFYYKLYPYICKINVNAGGQHFPFFIPPGIVL